MSRIMNTLSVSIFQNKRPAVQFIPWCPDIKTWRVMMLTAQIFLKHTSLLKKLLNVLGKEKDPQLLLVMWYVYCPTHLQMTSVNTGRKMNYLLTYPKIQSHDLRKCVLLQGRLIKKSLTRSKKRFLHKLTKIQNGPHNRTILILTLLWNIFIQIATR